MATAPTLFWYQVDTGTLMPVYYGQINTFISEMCVENAIAPPTAPWWNQIKCSLSAEWLTQIDEKTRILCNLFAVPEPSVRLPNLNSGQIRARYWQILDAIIRILAGSSPASSPLLNFNTGGVNLMVLGMI